MNLHQKVEYFLVKKNNTKFIDLFSFFSSLHYCLGCDFCSKPKIEFVFDIKRVIINFTRSQMYMSDKKRIKYKLNERKKKLFKEMIQSTSYSVWYKLTKIYLKREQQEKEKTCLNNIPFTIGSADFQ